MLSAVMICGRARIWSSKARTERGSCRAVLAATYTLSGNPAASGSSRAEMTRMTPDSFSRRTRCSVAAGDRPTNRASSTFVRSASACSSVSSLISISSSEVAISRYIIPPEALYGKLGVSVSHYGSMNFDRRAIFALAAAGMLWGCTVPATKLAVQWLPPGWLTVVRFGLAAAVLLVACRSRLRAACSPAVLAWGAVGYGGTILVQNEGVMRTSVSHAALLVGATPVLVAIIAALRFRSIARPAAWAGYAVSLGGICLVAGAAGGSATMTGDGLILVSLLLSASFTVAQPRVLDGRDPLAVTALQFLAATVAALPVAVLTEGMPPVAGASRGLLVTVALALGGTLLPFALFAFAQSRVSAATAAPFLNLEPLVGAAAGVVAFGDPFGLPQIAGAAAIVAGIAVSSVPLTGLLGLA